MLEKLGSIPNNLKITHEGTTVSCLSTNMTKIAHIFNHTFKYEFLSDSFGISLIN